MMPVNMHPSTKSPATGASHLKAGEEAEKAVAAADAAQQAAMEQAGKMWRWRIGSNDYGEDFKITFLDGDLDENGMLQKLCWKDHTINHAGQWRNFTCTDQGDKDSEPCPICAADNRAALVFVLTIIDHNPYVTKQGDTVKDRRKLFVFKRQSWKLLNKIAQKRGGLAGCTFEVSRSSEKAAAVGDMFEFVEKHSLEDLASAYGKEVATPADYGEEIVFHTAAQLRELGVGISVPTIGGGKPNLDNEL